MQLETMRLRACISNFHNVLPQGGMVIRPVGLTKTKSLLMVIWVLRFSLLLRKQGHAKSGIGLPQIFD